MILSTSRSSSSVDAQLVEQQRALAVVAAEQRVGDGPRLLVDLLVHEPVEAALLGGRRSQSTWYRLPSAGLPSKSVTVDAVAR